MRSEVLSYQAEDRAMGVRLHGVDRRREDPDLLVLPSLFAKAA